jgi:hypothetical protein
MVSSLELYIHNVLKFLDETVWSKASEILRSHVQIVNYFLEKNFSRRNENYEQQIRDL